MHPFKGNSPSLTRHVYVEQIILLVFKHESSFIQQRCNSSAYKPKILQPPLSFSQKLKFL